MFTRAFDRITLVGALPTTPEIIANSKSRTVKFHCEFCTQSPGYCSDTEVAVHKQQKHKRQIVRLFEKNKNVCRMCVKRTPSRAALLKHFKTSHLLCNGEETRIQRDVYICNDCNSLFFSKLMLLYHLSYVHKFKCTKITCPKCEKQMKFSSAYSHFEGHMLRSVCTCQLCFLKFGCKKTLQTHVKSYHSYSFKCNMCSYECNKHSNLLFHTEKAHMATSGKSLDLGVVKKYFIEAEGMKPEYVAPLATRGVSFAGMANLCILCREICSDQQEMLDHFTRVHVSAPTDNKKKYHCSCGETFFNSVLLKHHIFKLEVPHRILTEDEVMRKVTEENEEAINPVARSGDDPSCIDSSSGEHLIVDETADHLIPGGDLDGRQASVDGDEKTDVAKMEIYLSGEDFSVDNKVADTFFSTATGSCDVEGGSYSDGK